jgi:hypothetical protein
VASLIVEGELTGKVKDFQRGPAAFLGGVLAHEAHHRVQIVLNLKHAKLPVDLMFCFSLYGSGIKSDTARKRVAGHLAGLVMPGGAVALLLSAVHLARA